MVVVSVGSYQSGITIFSWEEGRTTAANRVGSATLYSVPVFASPTTP